MMANIIMLTLNNYLKFSRPPETLSEYDLLIKLFSWAAFLLYFYSIVKKLNRTVIPAAARLAPVKEMRPDSCLWMDC